MAAINKYEFLAEEIITPTVLGASDTVQLNITSRKSVLVIDNITAGALTLNVLGDTATSVECPGVGSIDLTGGKDFSIGIGETWKLPLNTTYQKWLGDGNLTITGGDGAEAYVLES